MTQLKHYSNGSYDFCKFNDEAVKDLISTTEKGFESVVTTLKELEEGLISKATDRVPVSIFKLVVYTSLLTNMLVVIWFTGIAPILKGIGFKEIKEVVTEIK